MKNLLNKEVNKFFEYSIKRQDDGSFVVLEINKRTNKVDIISHHDTYEEASDWLRDHLRPLSQMELIDYFKQIK